MQTQARKEARIASKNTQPSEPKAEPVVQPQTAPSPAPSIPEVKGPRQRKEARNGSKDTQPSEPKTDPVVQPCVAASPAPSRPEVKSPRQGVEAPIVSKNTQPSEPKAEPVVEPQPATSPETSRPEVKSPRQGVEAPIVAKNTQFFEPKAEPVVESRPAASPAPSSPEVNCRRQRREARFGSKNAQPSDPKTDPVVQPRLASSPAPSSPEEKSPRQTKKKKHLGLTLVTLAAAKPTLLPQVDSPDSLASLSPSSSFENGGQPLSGADSPLSPSTTASSSRKGSMLPGDASATGIEACSQPCTPKTELDHESRPIFGEIQSASNRPVNREFPWMPDKADIHRRHKFPEILGLSEEPLVFTGKVDTSRCTGLAFGSHEPIVNKSAVATPKKFTLSADAAPFEFGKIFTPISRSPVSPKVNFEPPSVSSKADVEPSPVSAKADVTSSPVSAETDVTPSPVSAKADVTPSPVSAKADVMPSPVSAKADVAPSPVSSKVTPSPVLAKADVKPSPVSAKADVRPPTPAAWGKRKLSSECKANVTPSPVSAKADVRPPTPPAWGKKKLFSELKLDVKPSSVFAKADVTPSSLAKADVKPSPVSASADVKPSPPAAWGNKKLFSDLLKKDVPQQPAPIITTGRQSPSKSNSRRSSSSPSPRRSSPVKLNKANEILLRFSGVLNSFDVDARRSKMLTAPRGLINNSNTCYINSVLQVLLECGPFYNLIMEIGQEVPNAGPEAPLIESLIAFAQQMEIEKPNSTKQTQTPLLCDPIFDVLRRVKKLDLVRGRQEDAEELLSHILSNLHDEMVHVSKLGAKLRSESANESSRPSSPESANWLEVGPKNKVSVTRTVSEADTPVTRIFGGKFRSILKACGQKDSVTVEPFRSLQLDISVDNVNSIEDAILNLAKPEVIENYTVKNVQVPAQKQLLIEELPPVLVLQLKRFKYTSTGGTEKVLKDIAYPDKLNFAEDILAQKCSETPAYTLKAVVSHHGKTLDAGHYTARVFRNGGWVMYDDETVNSTVSWSGDKDAYLLFYERICPPQTPVHLSIRHQRGGEWKMW